MAFIWHPEFGGDVTITLASLASGSARESSSFVYSNMQADDIGLQFKLGIATPTSSGDKAIYIWFYASIDGTYFTEPATGSNAAITIGTNHNLFGPYTVAVNVGTLLYDVTVPSVAQFFGGVVPGDLGIVIENQAGGALWGTEGDFVKKWIPVINGTII